MRRGEEMKVKTLKITKLDNQSIIEINGEQLEKVLDYKITSSAYGTTELCLKIDIPDALIEFKSLTT